MAALARTVVEHLFFFSSRAVPPSTLPLYFLSLVVDKCAYAFVWERRQEKHQSWPMQHRRIWLHPAVVSDSGCLISTPNHSKGTGSDSLDSKPSWQSRPADIITTGLVSELFSLLSSWCHDQKHCHMTAQRGTEGEYSLACPRMYFCAFVILCGALNDPNGLLMW